MKKYFHLNGKDRLITVLEEDENWVLGEMKRSINEDITMYRVFCKSCLWYVGYGDSTGDARHSNDCPVITNKMNSSFIKKAKLLDRKI